MQGSVAEAKTAALHQAISSQAPTMSVSALLGVTILALCSGRVRVTRPEGGKATFEDLALCLLGDDGTPFRWREDVVRRLWAQAVCRLLLVEPTPWDAPAEWVGRALRAALPAPLR